MRFIVSAFALLATAATASASPILVGNDFSYNAGNGMPAEELAIAAYLDGNAGAELGIKVDCAGTTEWLMVGPLTPGVIETVTYDLNGCTVAGRAGVRNVVGNGVVDGFAFGLLWKDTAGDMHIAKSDADRAGNNHVMGVWPLGFASDSAWISGAAPNIVSGTEILRTLIPGAVLVDNGVYRFATN
jgi:hypothetical protein